MIEKNGTRESGFCFEERNYFWKKCLTDEVVQRIGLRAKLRPTGRTVIHVYYSVEYSTFGKNLLDEKNG